MAYFGFYKCCWYNFNAIVCLKIYQELSRKHSNSKRKKYKYLFYSIHIKSAVFFIVVSLTSMSSALQIYHAVKYECTHEGVHQGPHTTLGVPGFL